MKLRLSRKKHLTQSGAQCILWCAGYTSFILATAYILSNAEDSIKDFFNSLENAKAYARRGNMSGVIFVGDSNARSFLWGVTRCNKSGEMLVQFVKKPEVNILNDGENTFYAANGASIIDLFIVTDSVSSWKLAALFTRTLKSSCSLAILIEDMYRYM